ncbi:unnamed protein product [Darwinula stevensoni]|uniref:26S proteasome regulatory subunit Rpn6 N-terminal domain-containing protein n=1 Tax=Darwinula stevensoni TaxID=69355 RepID=A0A7R9A2S7_9CRUS|nr:unnamed protein product [Darwinula stevensoni]CAG0880559.1 unnamed protein product [Darwinula stevensoni]
MPRTSGLESGRYGPSHLYREPGVNPRARIPEFWRWDLPNAMNAAEITDKLGLHSLRNRNWYIQATCATSGDGLYEGLDWLANQLKNANRPWIINVVIIGVIGVVLGIRASRSYIPQQTPVSYSLSLYVQVWQERRKHKHPAVTPLILLLFFSIDDNEQQNTSRVEESQITRLRSGGIKEIHVRKKTPQKQGKRENIGKRDSPKGNEQIVEDTQHVEQTKDQNPKMAAAALLERAQALSTIDKKAGIDDLKKIVNLKVEEPVPGNDEEVIRLKEMSILELGERYRQLGNAKELGDLIKEARPFLACISKAKAAKLVRELVDKFLDMEAGTGMEVQLCKECIEWARQEKRTFLRQSLESRLVALYFDNRMYTDALHLGSQLLHELKKLDDKHLLVEVQLLESKTYHALSNLPKARAALTSARTTANAIYCPPKLQASLDLQSGGFCHQLAAMALIERATLRPIIY